MGTKGEQPRGIATPKEADNKSMNDSVELAKKMFPSEKFIEQESNIFVSEFRIPKNKQQKEVFEKELKMAQIAKNAGHCICLLSERGTGKNPDSIMDGEITEFKNITGNIKAVGKRFSEAMKQGKNVFLNIESDLKVHDVYKKIKGEINANNYKTGKIFIFCSGKMYIWSVEKFL